MLITVRVDFGTKDGFSRVWQLIAGFSSSSAPVLRNVPGTNAKML
jgi:hypothetical protein